MTRWTRSLIILILGIQAWAGTDADTAWQQLAEDNGIRIFYREDVTPGKHWVRAVVTDSVSMDVVGQVLLDVNSYPKWMAQLRDSHIVSANSADDYILYNYYDLPWPMWDRDIYVHVVIKRDSVHQIVTASIDKYESPQYPLLPKVIRVPSMTGYLKIQALAPKVTRGEFTERLDLGGSVPEWAKTYLSKQTPAYILKKVRAACQDSFYIKASRCASSSKGCP